MMGKMNNLHADITDAVERGDVQAVLDIVQSLIDRTR
jgi:hypothetical protein